MMWPSSSGLFSSDLKEFRAFHSFKLLFKNFEIHFQIKKEFKFPNLQNFQILFKTFPKTSLESRFKLHFTFIIYILKFHLYMDLFLNFGVMVSVSYSVSIVMITFQYHHFPNNQTSIYYDNLQKNHFFYIQK